jgi:hypothetical protein
MHRHGTMGWSVAMVVLILGLGLGGCNSSTGSGGSGAASASAAARGKAAGASLAQADLEARVKKAGWTVDGSEEMDVEYKRLRVRLSKQEGDKSLSADVNVLYLTEPFEPKNPKAVVQANDKGALRVAWVPDEGAKKGPDLEAIKKDILAKAPPEKVTDDVFFKDFDKLVAKWKLTDQSSRGGGSTWGAVFQNYRYLSGEGGTVSIHAVGLGKGAAKIVGTNVVWVDADDDALAQKVLAIVTG